MVALTGTGLTESSEVLTMEDKKTPDFNDFLEAFDISDTYTPEVIFSGPEVAETHIKPILVGARSSPP